MKQFVLDHLSNACSKSQRIAACQRNADADLAIDLETGTTVAVYIINRDIRIPEIRETFERNTAKSVYTLFIVDGRMMPKEHEEVAPPMWMEALHALAHGRIYAYWCDRQRCTIRPVHMGWKWGGGPRLVEYGPVVDIDNLRISMVDVASKYITGYYALADFSDMNFWKKRDPNDARQFKYSWRQWSYTGRQKASEQSQQEEAWDPWESFARHYGHVSGAEGEYENYRQRQRKQRRRAQSYTTPPLHRDYAILGVPVTATYEEVKRAYRVKARENHPDMHPPQEKEKYTARMADINKAFESISKRLK